MSDTTRNSRKVRTGTVVSISGNKTIVVQTMERKRHPKYGKMMTFTKKLHAHDEECTAAWATVFASWRPVLCPR